MAAEGWAPSVDPHRCCRKAGRWLLDEEEGQSTPPDQSAPAGRLPDNRDTPKPVQQRRNSVLLYQTHQQTSNDHPYAATGSTQQQPHAETAAECLPGLCDDQRSNRQLDLRRQEAGLPYTTPINVADSDIDDWVTEEEVCRHSRTLQRDCRHTRRLQQNCWHIRRLQTQRWESTAVTAVAQTQQP